MFERIKQMLVKEFIQVFRDPKMKGVIFLMPIIQVLVFGYAVTTDVKHVATAVYDLDNSVASRELIARFEKSGYFDIAEHVYDEGQARDLVDRGTVRAVLRINRGFGDELRAGRTAVLQVIVDGTDSNTAGIVLDYSAKIVGRFSEKVLITRFTRLKGFPQRPAQVTLATRAWFNENLESRNFYVPGVIAIIVLLVTLMLTSMAIVREKEIGTMEQIMVSPIGAGTPCRPSVSNTGPAARQPSPAPPIAAGTSSSGRPSASSASHAAAGHSPRSTARSTATPAFPASRRPACSASIAPGSPPFAMLSAAPARGR